MDSSNIRVDLKVDEKNLKFGEDTFSREQLESFAGSEEDANMTSQTCFQKIYKK